MFRYDRPQAGRYRQFHQVGAEAIGGESPALDVEMIEMIMTTLEKLGFRDLVLKLNSVGCPVCRGPYRELLKVSLSGFREELCRDCSERADRNPLRVFDCKHCGAVKTKLPTILSNLCDTCKQHYASVKTSLAEMGIPFEEDPYLVRGLDYYTRTSFEVLHSRLGAQNALCGGGRYDNLVEDCGGPSTPAVGFSAGLERIISVLPEHSAARESAVSGIDFYIICADEEALSRSLRAASLLREFGNVSSDFSMRSIKKQLRNARKGGARITVIADSSSRERLIWRDMAQRWQTHVPDNELLSFAKEHFGETKGDSS
jgi:histidyl-tRNA synthetase